MIRVLLSILAVVAIVLAIVLERPLLFALAAGLMVTVMVIQGLQVRRRHLATRAALARNRTERSNTNQDLGIIEIRPKKGALPKSMEPSPMAAEAVEAVEALVADEATARSEPGEPAGGDGMARPDEDAEAPPQTTDAAEAIPLTTDAHLPEPEVQDQTETELLAETDMPEPDEAAIPSAPVKPSRNMRVRARNPEVYVAVEAATEGYDEEVFVPSLHALRAALGAQTVCLLRQDELALKYHLDAVVSQNAYAKSGGFFTTRTPLISARLGEGEVSLQRVGPGNLTGEHLGYYRTRIAVRQVAMTPVAHASETTAYFLLADSMVEAGLSDDRSRRLLVQFARLLGTLLAVDHVDMAVPHAERILSLPSMMTAETASSVAAPPRFSRDRTADAPSGPRGLRPRRDIIAEEMAEARSEERPLALALVYLNRAETFVDEASIVTAEAALRTRLHAATPQGRVERFGELTYGVFFSDEAAAIEAWAARLQDDLLPETGVLAGGVSVGVALLQDRHEYPEDLRAEAKTALYESYKSGVCVIYE